MEKCKHERLQTEENVYLCQICGERGRVPDGGAFIPFEHKLTQEQARNFTAMENALEQAFKLAELHSVEVMRLEDRWASATTALRAFDWQVMDTAPKGELVLVALIRDGVIWRVSDAQHNGLGWYTKNGRACHWRTHWARMPTLRPPETACGT